MPGDAVTPEGESMPDEEPQDRPIPEDWMKEAGRFLFRCGLDGQWARSTEFHPNCLWHGENCIDWYLMVPADQVPAALYAAVPVGEPAGEPT